MAQSLINILIQLAFCHVECHTEKELPILLLCVCVFMADLQEHEKLLSIFSGTHCCDNVLLLFYIEHIMDLQRRQRRSKKKEGAHWNLLMHMHKQI